MNRTIEQLCEEVHAAYEAWEKTKKPEQRKVRHQRAWDAYTDLGHRCDAAERWLDANFRVFREGQEAEAEADKPQAETWVVVWERYKAGRRVMQEAEKWL